MRVGEGEGDKAGEFCQQRGGGEMEVWDDLDIQSCQQHELHLVYALKLNCPNTFSQDWYQEIEE